MHQFEEIVMVMINGGIQLNKLNYVAEQTASADQVLYKQAPCSLITCSWSNEQSGIVKMSTVFRFRLPFWVKSAEERRSRDLQNPFEWWALLPQAAMFNFGINIRDSSNDVTVDNALSNGAVPDTKNHFKKKKQP